MKYTVWQKMQAPYGGEEPARGYLIAEDETEAKRLFTETVAKIFRERGYTPIGEPKAKSYEEGDESIPLGEEELTEEDRQQREHVQAIKSIRDPIWAVSARLDDLRMALIFSTMTIVITLAAIAIAILSK